MKLVFRTVLVITVGVIALVPSTLAQTLDLARDGEIVNSSKTGCINVKVAKGKQARLRVIADTTEKGQQLSMKWDGRTVCGGKGSSSCQYDATVTASGTHQITISTTTPPYKLWRFLVDWRTEPNIDEIEEIPCK